MKNAVIIICLFLVILPFSGESVQLENWRLPWYKIAQELGELQQSPSGMFWDDLTWVSPSFAPGLWPDTQAYKKDHWTLEPSASLSANNVEYVDGNNYFWTFDILNDIKYKRFTARQTLDVDSRYSNDPTYYWKDDRIAAGRIEEAYLQYTGKYGMFRFGRLKRNWGPFVDRSLLLSNNAHSFDAFEWQIFSSIFEFRHMFASFVYPWNHFYSVDFDNYNPAATPEYNRYFSAHSLNFMIGEWATLGITETIIFSRRNQFPDLQYLNPFSIYTVTNTNMEGSGNLIVGLQWKVHPFTKKVSLLGQVAFDDIQVDNEGAGDQEPTHWGIDVAGHWHNPLPVRAAQALSLEYSYGSRWLYTVADANANQGERYIYMGKSLGRPTIDGDLLGLSFTLVPENYWAATLGIRYERRGLNTPKSRWSEYEGYDSTSNVLNYRPEPPLSTRDNLDRILTLSLDARGYFRDFADIRLGFANKLIQKTEKGIKGDFEYEPEVHVTITAHYSNFFLSLPDK
ncbi:MAG: hypothetical protein GF401_07145 [Chitinivibrionales bacterium]|nr:hypothetical protein [Chitinivibrionales bacterium]